MAGVNVGTAYLEVIPSARGFSGKLQSQISGGMESAGSNAGDVAGKGFATRFKSGVKVAALAGAAALAGGLAMGIGFVKDSIAEARESQKVGALTTQVIKSTGGAAKVTADQVGDLATAISNKTGIDDEAIQSGANMLLTFKNIRNEAGKGNDIFNQSTQILTDMASAMGTEPKQAAIQLGKALNDPVKGITALTRAGVTFTDQQKKTIESLVAGGKTAEAQKIILAELNSEFGGAAEAQATAGEKLATTWANFKEQIGTALLPIIDKLATFLTDKVIPAASQLFEEFKNGEGAGGVLRDILEKIGGALGTLFDSGQKVVGFLKDHKEATVAAAVAVGALVLVTKAHAAVLAVQAAGGLLSYIKNIGLVSSITKVWTAVQWAMNVALNANPIGLVVIAIAALAAGLIYAYKNSETFRNVVDTAFQAIGGIVRWLWNTIFAPFIRFLVNGFATLMDWVGNLLDALSHVPGFGWAKDAADKMHGAAKKAHEMADGIKDIPDNKQVTVTITAKMRASQLAINTLTNQYANKQSAQKDIFARASGGPVYPGGLYAVGDNPDGSWNSTTELFVPKTAGTIYTQQQLAGMGGGGIDYDRLAFAMSRVQLRTSISASSIDHALGATL